MDAILSWTSVWAILILSRCVGVSVQWLAWLYVRPVRGLALGKVMWLPASIERHRPFPVRPHEVCTLMRVRCNPVYHHTEVMVLQAA